MSYEARGRCDICYVGDGVSHKPWCEFGEGCDACSAKDAELERLREEKTALHEAYTIQLRLKESAEASLRGIEARASGITYIVSLIQRHPDDSFGAARAISEFIKEGTG